MLLGRFTLILAGVLVACAGSNGARPVGPTTYPAAAPPPPPPTCLVLSAGGPKGIAHLGAIHALRERQIPINCVVGVSMGALVGAVYASLPQYDTTARFRLLMSNYLTETKAKVEEGAVGGATVVGILGGILCGGWCLVAGGLVGGTGGANAVPKVDRDRVVGVTDRFFGGVNIEQLPVPFATFTHQRTEDGVALSDIRSGNLALAVGDSIANPFIFKNLEVKQIPRIDPGADRMAAIPVDDACRVFPGVRIIAVNVTKQPLVVSTRMTCEVREITIQVGAVNLEEVLTLAPAFDGLVALGRNATLTQLDAYGFDSSG